MRTQALTSTLVFIIIVLATTILKAGETKEEIAIQQAEVWLASVDTEEYGDSWDRAASFFKDSLSKEQWVNTMNAHRKPLGKLIKRKLNNIKFVKNLAGAPDGEYVVIQFETTFENKQASIETITRMLDGDGTWKVSGYFIK